ncbi:thiol reductant ABC exporter subunit CydD [Rhizomonospora bruguierae]|uniref:thiol reductant ABC exporter subunit CydD n=1 Tax=Rhizomonospora bruguierae TaxID=1581705 RepID=UPI0020BE8491|nr:thiol reductant ABC exporter subunit CydD [Micromonospora sp. NBRC 107566]
MSGVAGGDGPRGDGRRPPVDPRVLRRVPAARAQFALLGALAVATAGLIVAGATALATVLAAAAEGRLDRGALAWFVAAVAGRALTAWAQGAVAVRAAATVKAALRGELLGAVGQRGPGWLSGQRAGELATLAGRGLDALDDYITGYLPQMLLGAAVPVAVLARLAFADWGSALIVAATLPLIPVFAILVGWQTEAATRRQWRRLALLGGHFLDMVAGLPTLRAFGRARAQAAAVRRLAGEHRLATMRTLRIAFLSALVLELVATLSVALVAVPIGLRLLDGGLTLGTALLVLLLAPEAYLPLRAAGAKFHASMAGLTALDETFTILDAAPAGTDQRAGGPVGAWREIRFENVTVEYDRGAALRDATLTIRRGDRVALVGPSGAGKSTILAVLLGFVAPASGRVLVDGVDLRDLDIDAWRAGLAWVPQRPHLFAATLADNIRLGAPEATDEAVREAASLAVLPVPVETVVGERGHGLSSGQRQRVALARAFLRDPALLLLDEPTARLDPASEAAVLAATQRLAHGRTVLMVAHRPAMLPLADRTITVQDGQVTERATEAAA